MVKTGSVSRSLLIRKTERKSHLRMRSEQHKKFVENMHIDPFGREGYYKSSIFHGK